MNNNLAMRVVSLLYPGETGYTKQEKAHRVSDWLSSKDAEQRIADAWSASQLEMMAIYAMQACNELGIPWDSAYYFFCEKAESNAHGDFSDWLQELRDTLHLREDHERQKKRIDKRRKSAKDVIKLIQRGDVIPNIAGRQVVIVDEFRGIIFSMPGRRVAKIWCNQGWRDATVVAATGADILISYFMPSGEYLQEWTACVHGSYKKVRSINKNKLPSKWSGLYDTST